MILPDAPFGLLACVYAAMAIICIALLVWMDEPEKIKRPARAAFKLFLGILSYPVVVVAIILTFIGMMIVTVILYTIHRVNGDVRNYKVKVSFE